MQTIQLRSASSPASGDRPAQQGEAWISIDAADDEGRSWLASESGLDEEIVTRLLEPPAATAWRRFGTGVHFHMRAAVPGVDPAAISVADFGLWLEPGRIVTVNHGGVPALARAAEACAKGTGPSSAWGLVVFVLSEGLGLFERNLHDLATTLDQLEDEVLNAQGEAPIRRVAELQKRLIYARRFRFSLANMVGFISSQPRSVIDGALADELDGIVNAVAQHQELLSLSIERASALQAQIRDQLADSMNTATYRFTWVATVFLPLSFLTGLLGINVAGIPGDHDPVAFWLVCGALCFIAAAWGIIVGRFTRPFGRRSRSPEP